MFCFLSKINIGGLRMENKTENSEIIEKYKLKDILASSNINFLFGSGINGRAFPQLNETHY